MRVRIVGARADRERLRRLAEASLLEIAGEFDTLQRARADSGDADAILLAAAPREAGPVHEPLTRRELDVLALLADGLSNKRIAAALGISDQTVKFHVAAICGKLGVANRTEAVRRAIRRGLVTV
jgi:DNA-binding NarL/FixJ family response regulator